MSASVIAAAGGVTAAQLATAVALSYASGYVATGSNRDGLISAGSTLAFYQIGTYFQGVENANIKAGGTGLETGDKIAKVAAHAAVGGLMNRMRGGQFGSGAASAGLSAAVGPQIEEIDTFGGQLLASSVLGGTASKITGGKFANGAVTAAFSFAYNHRAHQRAHPGPKDVVGSSADDQLAVEIFQSDEIITRSNLKEKAVVVHADGTRTYATKCSNSGCQKFDFPSGTKISDLRLSAHTHEESIFGGVQGAKETALRERPGRLDHLAITKLGIPNYFKTPTGAVRVLERRNGNFEFRTVEGNALENEPIRWSPPE